MFGRLPALGGSTFGPDLGILSGGIWRPFASIATDVNQYSPSPFQGFSTQRAQLLVHEENNSINCVTAISPWFAPAFTATEGQESYPYERERVQTLNEANFYRKYRDYVTGWDNASGVPDDSKNDDKGDI
jgi:hypothetical protein